jgi:hypothetical protein
MLLLFDPLHSGVRSGVAEKFVATAGNSLRLQEIRCDCEVGDSKLITTQTPEIGLLSGSGFKAHDEKETLQTV